MNHGIFEGHDIITLVLILSLLLFFLGGRGSLLLLECLSVLMGKHCKSYLSLVPVILFVLVPGILR